MSKEMIEDDSNTTNTTTTTAIESIPTLTSLLLSTAKALSENSLQATISNTATRSLTPNSSTSNNQNNNNNHLIHNSPTKLLSLPSSNEYLSSLLSLPLETLLSLPASLSTLSTSLDTDLSSLAFARYSSFLLSHASTLSISKSFNSLSNSLTSLLDSTSSLELSSQKFLKDLIEIRQKRERMSRVRERMEEVEDLLEASVVVEACVRAGYWSEAIDVAVRLKELNDRLLSDTLNSNGTVQEGRRGAVVLLDRVRSEVQLALLSLRARVLESLLQRELKLPGAVRGVGILRRMSDGGLGLESHQHSIESSMVKGKGVATSGGLGEDALRIVFLAARWRCLREELDSVEGQMAASGIKFTTSKGGVEVLGGGGDLVGVEENEERTRWTKRWIEVWREVVGESIGMYNEVFLSPSSLTVNLTSSLKRSHLLTATSPLTLFLSSSLSSLATTLSISITSLSSSASLSSLLTQLSYCSHSFARYGFEFREIEEIRERIETRVGEIVVHEWTSAGKEWSKEWNQGGGKASSSKDKKSFEEWLVRSESLSVLLSTPFPLPLDETTTLTEWNHLPPASIALLPPLARFLNAHVGALNSLRLLPAISLFNALIEKQDEELEKATTIFLNFVESNLSRLLSKLSTLVDNTSEEGLGGEELLSPEEIKLKRKLIQERKILSFTVTFFSRWVLPFIEKGLSLGVYGQLLGIESGKKIQERIELNRNKRREKLEEVWKRIEIVEVVE